MRISINLSSQQLLSPGLLKHVTAALKSTGIVRSSLGFEVTEQTLVHDVPKAAAILKRLRALGSYVCIDDFGTGFNTLTHLKEFPINCVKIDKSFVQDLTSNRFSRAICTSVSDLGRDLNLCVIAEGVETHAQSALLTELGCQELQGFLYGRPQPKEKFILNQENHAKKSALG